MEQTTDERIGELCYKEGPRPVARVHTSGLGMPIKNAPQSNRYLLLICHRQTSTAPR